MEEHIAIVNLLKVVGVWEGTEESDFPQSWLLFGERERRKRRRIFVLF